MFLHFAFNKPSENCSKMNIFAHPLISEKDYVSASSVAGHASQRHLTRGLAPTVHGLSVHDTEPT